MKKMVKKFSWQNNKTCKTGKNGIFAKEGGRKMAKKKGQPGNIGRQVIKKKGKGVDG